MNEITVDELLKLPNKILIDVREKNEFDDFAIPGAILIPLGEISNDCLLDKSKKIVLYCRSGVRSLAALSKLLKQNPSLDACSLKGGILAWQDKHNS